MTGRRRYDVVVVGARVAGAATALHLARAGHQVLVVDRAGPPADTVSTHAIMRAGVLQLRKSGVLDAIVRAGTPAIRRVDLVFGDERVSFPVTSEHGVAAYYAPRRPVLDSALLTAAVEAGAEFRTAVSVNDVVRDPSGRVTGVVARTPGGHQERIGAGWVVGADGTRSRIARAVNAAVARYHRPTNAVAYGYFAGIDAPGYEFRFVQQRNVGFIPTNDGLTLAFAGGPVSAAGRNSYRYLTGTLDQVAPDMAAAVRANELIGRTYRTNGTASVIRDPAGAGWALVGDASFTEDPISAHGITDALRDAETCAHAIDTALRDPWAEPDALATYRDRRDHFALPLFDHAATLAEFGWDAGEASRLLRRLGDIGDAECCFLTSGQSALPYGRVMISST